MLPITAYHNVSSCGSLLIVIVVALHDLLRQFSSMSCSDIHLFCHGKHDLNEKLN